MWKCISVLNFIEIGGTTAEICDFQYYPSLAWKCQFTPLFEVFGGTFPPNDVTYRPNLQKDHPWAEQRHLIAMIGLLYSYRNISALLCQKSQNFPTSHMNYRVDLRHYLTDPYQIWWTYRLKITDEHYCFRFSIFLPHYVWRRIICCN